MIADLVSYETIAITMFATMLLMLLTGQRVFGAIGFVAAMAALLLWGDGAVEMPYTAAWNIFKWYPMLTLPLFICNLSCGVVIPIPILPLFVILIFSVKERWLLAC